MLTEAGRALLPHAERTLAAAEEGADSVREVRSLAGGTMTFGTFGNAPYSFTADLVEAFRLRHPDVNVRLVGQNSSEVADAVRDGQIEAGLVVLPIDDRGLDVRPVLRDEYVYLSANPKHTEHPVTIEMMAERKLILMDARFGWTDPVRRQLADRAQRAGVRLAPVIEVEYMEAALELAARGLGDAIGALYLSFGRGFGRRLRTTTFDPPLYDTLAFIQRRNAHLSPATREFVAIVEQRVAKLRRGSAAKRAAA